MNKLDTLSSSDTLDQRRQDQAGISVHDVTMRFPVTKRCRERLLSPLFGRSILLKHNSQD